ncbi:MAG: hypothetical protein JWO19_3740 [Bryobacterales bacterium]|nr:hypothetical protein [Bryobacterales bacterium]
MIARAIATRWRCPPESVTPRLAHDRVVPVRELVDKLVYIGHLRGFQDF